MKVELTGEELKNIMESLDIDEIQRRKKGFYPVWKANLTDWPDLIGFPYVTLEKIENKSK
ncbi:hypothetical protein K9M79_02930 [Candidatus Woesearchaeota archaeon]|nr:hypothetical protein [Candidatus Woesearchaeota archaeon]